MGKNESIRDSVADVRVHNDDVSESAGKWICKSFTSGTNTYTFSSNVTILFAGIKVTAAANGFVTMGTTATATAIMALSSSAAFSGINYHTSAGAANNLSGATASNSTMVEITSGNSLVVCAADTVRGKYFFLYIKTPT